jgi:hypothetical protein
MAELKTKPTEASVEAFLNAIPDEAKRHDAYTVLALIRKATGAEAVMWGTSIVGFGDTHLKYSSGRELDWFVLGFAPRKQELTLYLNLGCMPAGDLLSRLGKHKTGKGCLYLRRLSEVDLGVLEALIERSASSSRT